MAKRQKDRQHNGQKTEGQTTQWLRDRRTDNTMAKRQKDIPHNGQKTEGQTIQWSKDRRTDHTMAKRKITKGQAMIYKALLRKLKIEQYDLH